MAIENDKIQITAQLNGDFYVLLRKLAHRKELSFSDMIREALKMYLELPENKKLLE